MLTQTNNIWTDVTLEQLHQRISYIHSDLLATDDKLLAKHVLHYKQEIQNRLQYLWNIINPSKEVGAFYTVFQLLEVCSSKGFQQMLIEKNITEDTLPDTQIFVSNVELQLYKQ
jgi:hypothetical protein